MKSACIQCFAIEYTQRFILGVSENENSYKGQIALGFTLCNYSTVTSTLNCTQVNMLITEVLVLSGKTFAVLFKTAKV